MRALDLHAAQCNFASLHLFPTRLQTERVYKFGPFRVAPSRSNRRARIPMFLNKFRFTDAYTHIAATVLLSCSPLVVDIVVFTIFLNER